MSRNVTLCALVVVSMLVCAGVAGVSARVTATSTGSTVFTIELRLARPGEATRLVRFDVTAPSEEEAQRLAEETAALAGLHPVSGDASAQWLPWSWSWTSSELPVPVAYNPTGAPLEVSPSVVLAGLQAWSNVPDSSFRYHYAGITDNVASILEAGPDGENVVSWASLPCGQGCVLGITSKESAHEVDMLLNSNPEAAEQLGVGATVDWRTVILHEFGHMAGLEHSCPVPFGPCTAAEADAVMYFQYRGILRKLAPDDIAGIAALYPSAVIPSPSPTLVPGVTPTPTPFPELPVLLEKGWNLVVLPSGPVSTTMNALPCASAAYGFEDDTWRIWIRGAPAALQELSHFEDGRAYWLLADSFCGHIFP
ncbi:MAG TPA: matrixin family metalloprotease [Vicinamibacterales bacterium]